MKYFILYFLPVFCLGQAELRIGEWRNQIPYNNGVHITQSDNAIYYATDLAILRINKSDFSLSRISRTEGLSGSRINAIFFHKPSQTLVIAYSDGLIDLMTSSGTEAIPFIKIFNNVPISKNINSISLRDDNSVFISADFGLVSLNLITKRVDFTVFTEKVKVVNTISFQDSYYMATSQGLYVLTPSVSNLIEDFSNWHQFDFSEGLDPNMTYQQVMVYENQVLVLQSNEILRLNGQKFESFWDIQDFTFNNASTDGPDLIVSMKYNFNNDNKLFILKKGSGWTDLGGECVVDNLQTLQEPNGRLWLADKRNGFRYLDDLQSQCKIITVEGPYNNNTFKLYSFSDGIYVTSGGWDETYTYLYRRDGIFTYKSRVWDFVNYSNNDFFRDNNIQDVLSAYELPDHSKIYYTSYQNGLIEWSRATGEYKLYDNKNTGGVLGNAVGDATRVRLTGLDYDSKSNKLWIADYLAARQLVSLDKTGNWASYAIPFSGQILDVAVDHNGYKWLVFRDGLAVFDDRNTPSTSDDRFIALNTSNSNLTTNLVYNVTIDIEGDVWVGTAAGPVIFECGSSIFDGNCKGTRRKVDQNGIIGYLLETEEVLCLAVDGANRKWIGTRNGLYVQSPSGEFQINYFNTDNSPLLSNNIFSLAVNNNTGEVWIGTDRGIQMYRSDATSAKDFFVNEPLVYPNPVTSDYKGPVAIKGLARDARVKITDLSGRLVFETFANGGQALWDRKDYLGNEVSSGIYLVFANTVKDYDKSDGAVTKLIITR
ncbi:MAG: hypothetical protein U0V49_07045 [Saprospiraceae bacterium]